MKELLGHLCDSAINNHYRFMFALTREKMLKLEPYQQDQWVSLSGYQNRSWAELIDGWEFISKGMLVTLQQKLEADELNGKVQAGSQFVTLEALISDYIGHLEHHLRQITSKTGVAFW